MLDCGRSEAEGGECEREKGGKEKGGGGGKERERDIFSENDARGDRCRPSALKPTMTLRKCTLPAPYSILESSTCCLLGRKFYLFR